LFLFAIESGQSEDVSHTGLRGIKCDVAHTAAPEELMCSWFPYPTPVVIISQNNQIKLGSKK
jgi:hypothetical protein